MRKAFSSTLLIALVLFLAGFSPAQDPSVKARDLLRKARQALGGEKKLDAVKSLSMSATFRREVAENMQVDGEFEVSILLPDRFKRVETMNLPVGGASVTRTEGFDGEQRFADSRTNSTGGGTIVFRRAEDRPEGQAAAGKAIRAEFAREVLALLLSSTAVLPLDFTYAGEAQSEDGTADVIEAKSSEEFSARLFLDKQTHLPLMLTYRTAQPQMKIMTQTVEGGREEAEKKKKELESHPPDRPTAVKEVDAQTFFADYREEDGILLPHHISRSVDGKPLEEWDVKTYKLNPPLKPETFKK